MKLDFSVECEDDVYGLNQSNYDLDYIASICFYRYRYHLVSEKKWTFNKPTILGISALFTQIVLVILLFSEVLVNVNDMIIEIFWWGTVLYSLIIGVKEAKKQHPNIVVNYFYKCFIGDFYDLRNIHYLHVAIRNIIFDLSSDKLYHS